MNCTNHDNTTHEPGCILEFYLFGNKHPLVPITSKDLIKVLESYTIADWGTVKFKE